MKIIRLENQKKKEVARAYFREYSMKMINNLLGCFIGKGLKAEGNPHRLDDLVIAIQWMTMK